MTVSWSGMRNKLEKEYLAGALRGHIRYYATSYSKSPDHEGRAAILLDGKEIIAGCYYNNWLKAELFPRDERYERRMKEEMAFIDDTAVQLGIFDQQSFYEAFSIFVNQSIEESLASENMLVRIFAILDRRVGKRRLEKIRREIDGGEKTFREFFAIRAAAEGMAAEGERER